MKTGHLWFAYLVFVMVLAACGKSTPPTASPVPSLTLEPTIEATVRSTQPTVTLDPGLAPTLTPGEQGKYQSVVRAFISANQLASSEVSYVGVRQVELDGTGPFSTEMYVDGNQSAYTVDPESQTVVAYEVASEGQTTSDPAQLSEDMLYARAEQFMLLNTPQYPAMREGFSLPETSMTDSQFKAKWVFGTTCRRDGSFPYIEVAVALDGQVVSYRTTLARGDRVGAFGDVNQYTVNVRSGPSLDFDVVTMIGAGRTIIMGQYRNPATGEKWWQIPINCAEPTNGWIRDEFITIDPAFVDAVPVRAMP